MKPFLSKSQTCPLSFWLFAGPANRGHTSDFTVSSGDPARYAEALSGYAIYPKNLDYASVVRPEYITALKRHRKGPRVIGSIRFEAPKTYRGHLDFVLEHRAGQWIATQLSMPAEHLLLRLDAAGNWKQVSKATDK